MRPRKGLPEESNNRLKRFRLVSIHANGITQNQSFVQIKKIASIAGDFAVQSYQQRRLLKFVSDVGVCQAVLKRIPVLKHLTTSIHNAVERIISNDGK